MLQQTKYNRLFTKYQQLQKKHKSCVQQLNTYKDQDLLIDSLLQNTQTDQQQEIDTSTNQPEGAMETQPEAGTSTSHSSSLNFNTIALDIFQEMTKDYSS